MKILSWLKAACIDFLILNLFLTIVSLPVLVAWGLPISWLSPLGNVLFNPFLTIFLLVSTLAFFCELLSIPHTALTSVLEKITSIWNMLLHLAPENSFIGCSVSAFYLLCFIAIATLTLLMLPALRSARPRLIMLVGMFACVITVLKAVQPHHVQSEIACKNKSITLLRNNHETIVIDEGAFSEPTNPSSWVQYDLIPELIKATGSLHINHLVITRPTIRALQAATALFQHAQVAHCYFPTISGEMSGSHLFTFKKWYAIAKSKEIALIRITKNRKLTVGSTHLTIVPGEQIQYRDCTYQPLKIS